jgi:hypothetical protein
MNELRFYTHSAAAAAAEEITGKLLALINGSTREEVDAQIASIKATVDSLVSEVAA